MCPNSARGNLGLPGPGPAKGRSRGAHAVPGSGAPPGRIPPLQPPVPRGAHSEGAPGTPGLTGGTRYDSPSRASPGAPGSPGVTYLRSSGAAEAARCAPPNRAHACAAAEPPCPPPRCPPRPAERARSLIPGHGPGHWEDTGSGPARCAPESESSAVLRSRYRP